MSIADVLAKQEAFLNIWLDENQGEPCFEDALVGPLSELTSIDTAGVSVYRDLLRLTNS